MFALDAHFKCAYNVPIIYKETCMKHILPFDPEAPKRAANLSVNADLLKISKEYHINLSQALEQALITLIKKKLREEWMKENKEAIEEYNERVKKRGVFSEGLRRF